jgi:hypothetical protein
MRTFAIAIFAIVFSLFGGFIVAFFEGFLKWQKYCRACELGQKCIHDPNWKQYCPHLHEGA